MSQCNVQFGFQREMALADPERTTRIREAKKIISRTTEGNSFFLLFRWSARSSFGCKCRRETCPKLARSRLGQRRLGQSSQSTWEVARFKKKFRPKPNQTITSNYD